MSVSGGEPPEKAALYTAEDARETLEAGFTTVQSVGAAIDKPVRDRIRDGPLQGPRVLTSLRQIQNRSGDPIQLRALVRQTKAEGADVIKLFATSGLGAGGNQTMTDAQIEATCGEAKAIQFGRPFMPSATRARARPCGGAARPSSTARS